MAVLLAVQRDTKKAENSAAASDTGTVAEMDSMTDLEQSVEMAEPMAAQTA